MISTFSSCVLCFLSLVLRISRGVNVVFLASFHETPRFHSMAGLKPIDNAYRTFNLICIVSKYVSSVIPNVYPLSVNEGIGQIYPNLLCEITEIRTI